MVQIGKRILITGGAGMIGSRLVNLMSELGYKCLVIDNLWRGKIKYLKDIKNFNISKDFVNADIEKISFKEFEKLGKIDSIIHLADIVAGINYVFNNEGEIFRKNNVINSKIISYAERIELDKFLYVGTACSFPKQLQVGVDSILKESDLFPAEPESAYGWSKLIGTLEMEYRFKNKNINSSTLFLHNVYGPNCDYSKSKSQVIPSLIHKVLTEEPQKSLNVWGNGKQSRAFIHVDDVCNAIIKTLEYPSTLPKIIQIGPSKPTTIADLAKLIIAKSGINKKIFFDLDKPTGDFGRGCDASRAWEILSWKESIKLEDGVSNLIDWIKKDME